MYIFTTHGLSCITRTLLYNSRRLLYPSHGLITTTYVILPANVPCVALRVQGAVWSCTLNKAALLCATGSADFSARLWDACSGNQLHEWQHNHIVRSTAFASDSSKLATGGVLPMS